MFYDYALTEQLALGKYLSMNLAIVVTSKSTNRRVNTIFNL